MRKGFLNILESEYAACEMTFLENYDKESKECDAFYDKYIKPLFERNQDVALNIESDFLTAVCSQNLKSFNDGFKTCMQMLLECVPDKAVKS